jgi:TPR repeat protein
LKNNPLFRFAEEKSDNHALSLGKRLASSVHCEESRKTAFRLCLGKAKNDSPFAMVVTSQLFQKGWGCKRDPARAFFWARISAESGYPPGHFRLGECFEIALGVEKSISAAAACYRRSLDGGYGFAAYQLANLLSGAQMYDAKLLRDILCKGIELNEPFAAFRLASWHEHEVPSDVAAAAKWYEKASAMGLALASARLAKACRHGELGFAVDLRMAAHFESLGERQLSR